MRRLFSLSALILLFVFLAGCSNTIEFSSIIGGSYVGESVNKIESVLDVPNGEDNSGSNRKYFVYPHNGVDLMLICSCDNRGTISSIKIIKYHARGIDNELPDGYLDNLVVALKNELGTSFKSSSGNSITEYIWSVNNNVSVRYFDSYYSTSENPTFSITVGSIEDM